MFEDRPDLRAPRARLWCLIAETPHLDWLLLTKRPENADRLWTDAQTAAWNGADSLGPTWPTNIWLGTTVEDQRRADERILHLLRVPAAVRFLSCEPLLEDVDLESAFAVCDANGEMSGPRCKPDGSPSIDWVIVGGESGHHARPFDVARARSIVAQCREAGVAPFVKQLGAHPVADGFEQRLKDKKGGDMSEWPADLRVREFPASAVKS